MWSHKRIFLLVITASVCVTAAAQEADFGFTMPVTISGGALYTHRPQSDEPEAGPLSAAFHVALYPSLKLGPHWFVYSSLHLRSTPFYYYDAYDADHEIQLDAVQAFLGYTRTHKSTTVVVKAGQLATAFGSFPLHYDDADNPLLDQPLPYATSLKLRADQLACSAWDLDWASYAGNVQLHCGGATGVESYGLMPVTLYGLPGIEVDVSAHKLDTRFQLTNSSPANPQSLLSSSQNVQWTGGAGYTLLAGLRVGASAFRGPYLDHVVAGFLPERLSIRDFPATGAGMDAQWARGRWSASVEFEWFRFAYPNFTVSPTSTFAYGELKAVVNPRTYLAARVGLQRNNHVHDAKKRGEETFVPNHQSYELALGFRPNRWQLLKVGYEWLQTDEVTGTRDNVLGIQLVTSIHSLSKAWR